MDRRSHTFGAVKLAKAPQDASIAAGVAAVEGVLVIQMHGHLESSLWRGDPGYDHLAPRHADIVVQLPCTLSDVMMLQLHDAVHLLQTWWPIWRTACSEYSEDLVVYYRGLQEIPGGPPQQLHSYIAWLTGHQRCHAFPGDTGVDTYAWIYTERRCIIYIA